jgi:hypothetical protein
MLSLHAGWCLPLPIPSSKITLPTQKLSIYPTSVKPHSVLTKSPNGFFDSILSDSSLNPTIVVSYHIVNALMMKT